MSFLCVEVLVRLLRKKEAAAKVGYHPVHLMRLAHAGKFPRPVRLGENAVAFVEDEVDAWIEAKIVERDGQVLKTTGGAA